MRTNQVLIARRTASILLAVVLLWTCTVVRPSPARADGPWRRFAAPEEPDPKKDLLSNEVRAMAYMGGQGPGSALLWAGTAAGLQTYDGRDWQDHSLPAKGVDNGLVNALAVDEQGTIWAGTELGLNRRSAQGEWRAFNLENMPVLSLAADDKGGVYAGTGGGGMWYCDGTRCDRVVAQESQILPADLVPALLYTPEGVLWIGTAGGLVRRRSEEGGDVWTPYHTLEGLPGDQVTALAMDGWGRLWIGTDEGATRYDAGQNEWVSYPLGHVYGLAVDRQDCVWAAMGDRLLKHDPRWESWERSRQAGEEGADALQPVGDANAPASVSPLLEPGEEEGGEGSLLTSWRAVAVPAANAGQAFTDIKRVFAAPDGMLWVRTENGLYGTDGSWEAYPSAYLGLGLSKVRVNVLERHPGTGELWAGTEAGVIHYAPGSDRWDPVLTPESGLLGNRVLALVRDGVSGVLWIGTDGGVTRYNLQGYTENRWTSERGLAGNTIFALIRGQRGDLWAGGSGGVSFYEVQRGRWKPIGTSSDGLGRVYALALQEQTESAPAGSAIRRFRLWAGTEAGLHEYTSATGLWRTLPLPSEPSAAQAPVSGGASGTGQVKALALDTSRGMLWVGMQDRVRRYDVNRERWDGDWKTADVLGAGQVLALFWDADSGRLWAGTEGGISSYDPATGRWSRTWAREDGLNSSAVQAIARGWGAGELWVGTDDGISHFTSPPGPLPWVSLTLALYGGKDIRSQGKVTLYGSQTVKLQLKGGSFGAERDRLRYSFQLRRGGAAQAPVPGGQEEGPWIRLEEQEVEIARDDLQFFSTYTFQFRVEDANGRASTSQPFLLTASALPFRIGLPREGGYLAWGGLLGGLLIGLGMAYALRRYPSYATNWGAARGRPVEQLIPLVAPLGGPLDVPRVQAALQKRQAYTTPEQVQQALDALVDAHILARGPGGGSGSPGERVRPSRLPVYVFPSPFVAWLHRLQNLRRVEGLSESVRSRHPLYAGARTFFEQADFKVVELSPEILMLIPGKRHAQATYGSIYTRIIAGHAPEGDDFEQVADQAREQYGEEGAHRLAFVVTNRRSTPGARYRLYEIRQRWGLAIVVLDSELFGQVKPNMPASQILTAQIDQATGRQNLYAISSPVSDDLSFFGRETVLQQLIDLADAGQPVGIFGLRKTGKTSLIQRLQGRLAARRVIASVDTQGTARERGVSPLYLTIIGALVAHIEQYRPGLSRTMPPLNLWPPPKEPARSPAMLAAQPSERIPREGSAKGGMSSPDAMQAFAADLAALHQHIGGDERLLLILDEVDRLLPAGDDEGYEGFSTFLGQLRAASQGLKLLDFILVGVDPSVNRRDKWRDRDNELYQALREVWVPAMDPEDAEEMIESIGLQMGMQYEPAALRLLAQAGGGQPFVTRQICSQVVRDVIDRAPATIDVAQARLGIERFVYMPESYLTELWRVRLDDAQRAVLLRLARSADPVPRADLLPAEQRQDALATLGALEEWTLVRRQAGGYVIRWGVLRDWIRWIELGLD